MGIREQFRKKLDAALEQQHPVAPEQRGEGDGVWRKELELYRHEVEAMAPIFAALKEIRQTAHIKYEKHGHDALTVEGLYIHVRITKTRAIYIFGERPDVKRHLALDDALDALIEYVAYAVAKRWAH